MSCCTKEWANEALRFGIRILKGYDVVCRSFQDRVTIALVIKGNLESFGWKWQAERLENWIHFFQRQHKDLQDLHIKEAPRP